MTTPTFKDLGTEQTTVRLYTPQDPYHYTIDNRPLQDLDNNTSKSVNATEAARRASLISDLNLSLLLRGVIALGQYSYIAGMEAQGSLESVFLNPGALLLADTLGNDGSENPMPYAWKIGGFYDGSTFDCPAPSTFGREIAYVVEAQYADINSGSETFPYEDQDNDYLASTCIFGKVNVRIRPGVEAATGSAVPPTTPYGWYALCVAKSSRIVDNGVATVIYEPSNIPQRLPRLSSLRNNAVPFNQASGFSTGYGAVYTRPQPIKITATGNYIINIPNVGLSDSESLSAEFWLWNASGSAINIRPTFSGGVYATVQPFDDGQSTVTKTTTYVSYTLANNKMMKLHIASSGSPTGSLSNTDKSLLITSNTYNVS